MKILPLSAALLATTLALPLAAQTTDAPAAGGGEAGLSLGAPEVGSTYVSDTFGDWEMRCIVSPEDQPDPCQLYQLLTDAQDNPVAEFNLFGIPEGNGDLAAGATVVTPLDTLLTGQMRMAVDSNPARVYPFSFCQQIGCYVRLGLSSDDIQTFRAGSEATISIVPLQAPDQSVPLSLSLSGFTAGFEALQAYNDDAVAQMRAAAEAQGATDGAASE
ncbi:invasion associated locus B family protein [Nioella nitratireducens]|uniref:invasion associated locus B family protein n=1 Tax=Nioella nitratireducens TaxID=1287720 RepID=UPI0008FD84E0|nr:invasion associated locus B family protein [Nioella nitratireducens]